MRRMLWFKLYNMISAIDKSGAAKISRRNERWKEKAKEKKPCQIPGVQYWAPTRCLSVWTAIQPVKSETDSRLLEWVVSWVIDVAGTRCDNTGAVLSSDPYKCLKMKIWLASSNSSTTFSFNSAPAFYFSSLDFLAHSSDCLWMVYKQGPHSESCLLGMTH